MKRKKYIKPSVQIEDVVTEEMLTVSVGIGESVESTETDAKGYRGSWGDLWSED